MKCTIVRVASVFVKSGGTKIRLTGGEPTVRKDFPTLLRRVGALPGLRTFAITTNGVRLLRLIPELKAAQVNAVNVSLDSLDPTRYRAVTGVNAFHRVWEGIMQLLAENFCVVKLNVVLLRHVNADEIEAFAALTRDLPLHVRFIEFMPFQGNDWSREAVVPKQEILARLRQKYPNLRPVQKREENSQTTGAARVYRHRSDGEAMEARGTGEDGKVSEGTGCFAEKTETTDAWKTDNQHGDEEEGSASLFVVPEHAGGVGIISSVTDAFCASCNRIRLTADGHLKNCLFSPVEFSVLPALRPSCPFPADCSFPVSRGEASEETKLRQIFAEALREKKESHGGILNVARDANRNRPMIRIGG
ncbi:putative molybdopterin synthase [Neospora caninum Liverpool]|uniref:Putative molybdopterin synthase n=1 Tax=Neospora caninum (strain Liverpool) TaxID=572307 RepID=F0VD44_NEOCL|nr:putative molybdopterin synthase [Neospora caninum Liverpool]CBZ51559.1 putative molybdopterin synthase [Neospora caninum Liverpool]|eukprot:XP_003881592.1 putative molybdopterin synthase [Neospora caninum Liverpool]